MNIYDRIRAVHSLVRIADNANLQHTEDASWALWCAEEELGRIIEEVGEEKWLELSEWVERAKK